MLINVQEEYKEAIMQYRLEHLDEAVICGSGDLQNYEHYEDWKKWIDCHEQKQTLPKGRVWARQYLFVEEHQLLGMVNIRLELNDYLFQYGGHIGYSIARNQRGKGYGKKMLKEALAICRQFAMHDVLLVAKKDNLASIHTILSNGGVFENEVKDGKEILKRYFIHI